MKVEVVSTFSPAYYDRVAKYFVASCIEHLSPSIKLKLYVDDFNIPTADHFELINLEETVVDLKNFKERNKDRPQDDWRHAAIVFSHKVYATCHAAKNTDADVLIWLDADAEIKKHIDEKYLLQFLSQDYDIGCLKRKRSTETGFLVFNLRNKNTHMFLENYKKIYDTDELFKHKEWHDGYIFDRVCEELENKGMLSTKNISPEGTRKSHFNNLHKGYIIHHKGDDKDKRNAQ